MTEKQKQAITILNNLQWNNSIKEDDYIWCEPDGNIDHCRSDAYPFGKWFEVEYLSADLTEPKVII